MHRTTGDEDAASARAGGQVVEEIGQTAALVVGVGAAERSGGLVELRSFPSRPWRAARCRGACGTILRAGNARGPRPGNRSTRAESPWLWLRKTSN